MSAKLALLNAAGFLLLRPDGTPRRFARSIVFHSNSTQPRFPFSRTLFRKNGLPRSELGEAARDYLGSIALEDWIARYDTPSAGFIERLKATTVREDVTFWVEVVDTSDGALAELKAAIDDCIGLSVPVRILPRNRTDDEVALLQSRFGKETLRDEAPQQGVAILLLDGAIPRAHGPRLLIDALLAQPSALLAYADEVARLSSGGLGRHWFKPLMPSPVLAGRGSLLGRLVAVRLTTESDRNWFQTQILSPNADVRSALARGAASLDPVEMIHTPYIASINTKPAAPPLPLALPPLPDDLPMTSIIIPTRNGWSYLSRCLASLEQTDWPRDRLEIIVVDNGSTEQDCLDGLKAAEEAGRLRVIRHDEKFNYARINNVAARAAKGDLLVLLNNDTEARRPDWLKQMAALALLPKAGAVGPKLLYPDDTVQHAGVVLGMNGGAVHSFVGLPLDAGGYQNLANMTREIGAVTAACLTITREAYEAVGGLNETFEVAFNDVVLCCDLLAAGFANYYLAEPLFYHFESKSRGPSTTPEKRAREEDEARRAIALHPDLFAADPYYSPNLSLDVFYKPSDPPRRPLL